MTSWRCLIGEGRKLQCKQMKNKNLPYLVQLIFLSVATVEGESEDQGRALTSKNTAIL
jgi:hypothetical protein